MRKKRKINSGLKAWNDARSFFSKANKKAGKKFNGVELNALTKSFLLENYGKSFDKEDLDNFLKYEVPSFYDNIFDVTIDDLSPVIYFLIDDKLSNYMPKNVNILVDAGQLGTSRFNSSEYNYYDSGVRDIVEIIREVAGDDSSNLQFSGSIERINDKIKKDSKNPDDFYIKWTLDEYGGEASYDITPKIEETRILPPSVLAKSKKKVPKKIIDKVKEQEKSKQILKENIELKSQLKEKEKQITDIQKQMLEMQKQFAKMQKEINKLKNKK